MFEPGERLNVGQIVAASTLSRTAVSHHLRVLREAGVLTSEKIGKEVFFWTDVRRRAGSAGGGAGLPGNSPIAARERRMESEHSQFQLLRERRFAPFFWTQFLGAGNDNIYKNALVIFVAFQAATLTALSSNDLVNVAAAVFIAPFMFFSATAGQIADKYEKSRLIRFVKLFEIAIMVVGAIGFYRRDLILLFLALGLMGVHSTLFGPVKYAILPQNLRKDELIGGNGLVEMGTFVAILLGEIIGGLVIAIKPNGPILAGATAIAVALAGYSVSRRIPETPAVAPDLRINWNPFTETWRNIRFAHGNRVVWLSMLGISWFWFYGATFLTQFAEFHQGRAGRRRARRDAAAGDLLRRHRRGFAAVRAAVRTQGRDRPGALRLHRPVAVRRRPVLREPRAAGAGTERRRQRSWPCPRTGASSRTWSCSACSAASTSCRCMR